MYSITNQIDEVERLVNDGLLDSMSIEELGLFIKDCEKNVASSSYDKFVEYNERDVELVERLDDKLKFIQNLIAVAFMVKGRFEDAQATVKPWDSFVYNKLLELGKQPPPHPEPGASQIVGGYVKEPTPGLKKWVVTLDLASLYPNIVRTLNMSPETIVDRGDPIIEQILRGDDITPRNGLAIAANGSTYRQDFVGVIPMLMAYLLDRRNAVKNEMKDAKRHQQEAHKAGDKQKEEEWKSTAQRLNATQQALKILANGGYGAIANRYFRYFDVAIAEGITMTGQVIIRFIGEKISGKMNELLETQGIDYVIGSDTDSCMTSIAGFMEGYIEACGMPEDYNELIDIADEFVENNLEKEVLVPGFAELSAKLGSKKSTLSMKREAIADRGLFRAKKHYVLQVWDNEGVRYAEPDLKMVGIETARTTTPKICKDDIEEALKIILNGTEEQLREAYKKWKLGFMSAPVEQIAFPRGVNDTEKWDEGTENQGSSVFEDDITVAKAKKGAPPQVKAALCYNHLCQVNGLKERDPIRSGSKLKFLYLKRNNPTGFNVVGFIDDLPREFGLDPWIDKNLQFEKALATPIESFTSLVNWNVTKRATLTNELFTEDVDHNQEARKAEPIPVKTKVPKDKQPVIRKASSKPKPSVIDFD